MIKNIFLPDKIGNKYIFAKRIVGFDIGKTHISTTQVYASGTNLIIEKCLEEKLDPALTTYEERVTKALKSIHTKLDKYDEVRTALSSSLAVFKELKLPFTSYEKINMIINFEVEPLLPFSLSDAVVDFIITHTNKTEQSSQVLVAAVQKQYIAQHLKLFVDSGFDPNVITIDLFGLYGLYQHIPSYTKRKGGIVLLDLGLHSTRMAYIHNDQLKLIRTLPKGMSTIAKEVAQELKIAPAQAMDHIMRFGLEPADWPEYSKAITKASTTFWNSVRFTLTSFTVQTTPEQSVNTLIMLGGGAELKKLVPFVTDLLKIPCELFNVNAIDKTIQIKTKKSISMACIISLATALPSPLTQLFNLRKDEFSIADNKLFYKQFITTIVLTICLLGGLFVNNYIQIKSLQNELQSSEQETIDALKKRFKNLEETGDLEGTIEEAQREVEKEEKTWFAFSGPARATFLKYLLELTNRIDKKALGFKINKITITEGKMMLSAEVKDFPSLKLLEKELRQSKLFSSIEPQNDTTFDMQITLAQNGKGI
jgi:type IV pilus assembly protein PilM